MKSGLRLAWLTCRQLLPVGLLVLAPLPVGAETAQPSEMAVGVEDALLESVESINATPRDGLSWEPEAGRTALQPPGPGFDAALDLEWLEPEWLEPGWLRSQDNLANPNAPVDVRPDVPTDAQTDVPTDSQNAVEPLDDLPNADATVAEESDAPGATPGAAPRLDAESEVEPDQVVPDWEEDADLEETTEPEATTEPAADAESGAADDEAIVEETDVEETDVEETDEATEDGPDDELTAAEARRRQLLIEGDRLFLQGDYLAAEQRYREAKDAFEEGMVLEQADPISDPALLAPAGQVYWREYLAGAETGLETRIFIPLELLTEEHPEFIPGHIEYAEQLDEADRTPEALSALERAASLYPNSPELALARVEALVEAEEWLQAAIAARQFALLNPDDPRSPELSTRAEEYQNRFRRQLQGRLTRNAIGNAITGALGFALTGNIFGPLSAIETTVLLIRGESAVGESIANRASRELDLIEDEVVVAYVNEMGQELAALAGRSEFEYEFYVVAEDELNAFALPGGKIFVNAGAITRTETGAEFAGLLAHELSHAVLSHGFQLVTGGNLTANVLQFIPYGGLATNLAVLRYSRDMERQADALGTQILASSPYAADGMHTLMQTLYEETEHRGRFDWLSTHPDVPERIENIETLITRNGYNRFAFEGIERHLEIRARVEQLLREAGKIDTEVDGEADTETNPEPERESDGEPDAESSSSSEMESQPESEPELPASTVNPAHANPDLEPAEDPLPE
ncbi:MAG: M48 family metalloprotease [Synechococcales bacterium]|nr:M48 family metalloprotease [Synechococcales bacterium]